MLIIFSEIILNWFLMGVAMAVILTTGLYFAVLCEKIVDYFSVTK